MKKVVPYMLLSFTLYSADPGQLPPERELQMASTKSHISKRGHGTFADFTECLDPVFSPMVVGYALLENVNIKDVVLKNVNTRDVLLGAALCGLVFQQLQIQGLIDTVDNNKKEQLGHVSQLNTFILKVLYLADKNFKIVDAKINAVKKDMGVVETILNNHTDRLNVVIKNMGLVETILNEHRVGLNGHTQVLKRMQSSVQKVASLTTKNDKNIEFLFNNQKNGLVRLGFLEGQMQSVFQLIRGSERTVYRKTH